MIDPPPSYSPAGIRQIAQILRALPSHLRARALLSLAPAIGADVLENLPDDIAAAAVMDMQASAAAPLVQEMQTDEGADLLQDIPSHQSDAILQHVDRDDASIVRQLMGYAEDSAGGLMQSEFIAIDIDQRTGDAVQQLRDNAAQYADYPASYLYVVDAERRLIGVVSLRALLLCHAEMPIAEITARDVVSVPVSLQGAELVKLFHRYRYLAIPVVDDQRRLLGVVTQNDAMQFAESASDEEMLKFTGILGGDEFREMPLRQRSWRRLSWLTVNIFLNVVAASVIAVYKETLQAAISLAVFLPIISDMSGCSGNQAVAVSIRELSLDRIRPRDFLWVIGKEVSVGLINGAVLGGILALIAWLWQSNVVLGVIVGAALWVNTIVAVIIGGFVPLLLKRLGQDPAIASGPILTTLTDVCGFVAVLAMARHWIAWLT